MNDLDYSLRSMDERLVRSEYDNKKFGIRPMTVNRVVNNKSWRTK